MLPGEDLIERGIEDLKRDTYSIEALLVSIGAPRLRNRIGIDLPPTIASPEEELYELLAESDSASAHSCYDALIRRLMSFESAAEHRASLRDAEKPR